jgi:hypothetical protein
VPDSTDRNNVGGLDENDSIVADTKPRTRLSRQRLDVSSAGVRITPKLVDDPLTNFSWKLAELPRG